MANIILVTSEIIKILVDYKVIAFAAAVSVVVGVVLELYPARNVSRLQPVDALRAE